MRVGVSAGLEWKSTGGIPFETIPARQVWAEVVSEAADTLEINPFLSTLASLTNMGGQNIRPLNSRPPELVTLSMRNEQLLGRHPPACVPTIGVLISLTISPVSVIRSTRTPVYV